jgi:hypothetical protein
MEGENKFWVIMWGMAAVFASVVVVSSVLYWGHYDSKVASLLKNGADPMSIKCAMNSQSTDSPACIILATKEGNK